MKPDNIDRAISELEGNIDRLQALYNQYFMGMEKLQPMVVHKTVERNIQLLRKERIKNTAQRFRLQTQFQRFNTLNNHWRRICREIEEGTYKRHIVRARRKQEIKKRSEIPADPLELSELNANEEPPAYDLSDDLDDLMNDTRKASFDVPTLDGLDLDDPFNHISANIDKHQETMGTLDSPFDDAVWPKTPKTKSPQTADSRPVTKQKGPPPKNIPPKSHRPKPKSDDPESKSKVFDARRAQAIFRRYLAARSKCNEPTENLTLDKVSKSLKKHFEAKGGDVDFKVVIRNGKAAIKTVPVKKEDS